MDLEDPLESFVGAIESIVDIARPSLEESKTHASGFLADDFIWEALLGSMSTLGNVRGYRLVQDDTYHRQVTWSALASLLPAERLLRLDTVLTAAMVRMSHQKARWLASNYLQIEEDGGPATVKAQLESFSGRDAKSSFLRRFAGIGEKYGRNILMDVYHTDFRDSIAIDARIKRITEALGLSFSTYDDEERFYLRAAKKAGLSGWELDRLMFGFKEQLISALAAHRLEVPEGEARATNPSADY